MQRLDKKSKLSTQFFTLMACFVVLVAGAFVIYRGVETPDLRAKRSFKEGKILPSDSKYMEPGFLLDYIVDQNQNILLYDRGRFNAKGKSEINYRFLLPAQTQFEITVNVNDPNLSPRFLLYDGEYKLSNLLEQVSPKPGLKSNTYSYRVKVDEEGFYRLKMNFDYINLQRASLKITLDPSVKPGKAQLAKRHIKKHVKAIALLADGRNLDKYSHLVKDQIDKIFSYKKNPLPEEVATRPFFKLSDRFIVRVKGHKDDGWAIASAGLAGRVLEHFPQTQISSLDIKVLSGQLPHGLKAFKLHRIRAKNYLRDMIFESILKDHGVLMPRHDLVAVFFNKQFQGFMELLEKPSSHFFEFAQRNEGPIWGFDAESIQGSVDTPVFEVKSYGKKAKKKYAPNISSKSFIDNVCQEPMELVSSFSLGFSALHSMLQTDLRFHANPRKNCYDPIVKDSSSGNSFSIKYAYEKPYLKILQLYDQLTYHWRPHTIYRSSQVLLKTEEGTKVDAMEWIPGYPVVLKRYADLYDFARLTSFMEYWNSDFLKDRVKSRLDNAIYLVELLDTNFPEEQKEGIQKSFREANAILYHTPKNLIGSFDLAPNALYLKLLIKAATNGELDADGFGLRTLNLRNTNVKHLGKMVIDSFAEVFKKDEELSKIDLASLGLEISDLDSLITFFYRDESDDFERIVFTERLVNGDNFGVGEFYLKDRVTGEEIKPKLVRLVGDIKYKNSKMEIILDDIKVKEKLKTYYFKVPKTESYRYMRPETEGDINYLGAREIVVIPKEEHIAYKPSGNNAKFEEEESSKFFAEPARGLWYLRASTPVVEGVLRVPVNTVAKVQGDKALRFGRRGCLLVEGGFEVDANSSLQLSAADASWMGAHFHDTLDLNINNLSVSGIGSSEDFVYCADNKYTGGLSFFHTRLKLNNVSIKNSNVEDAMHILRSIAELNNINIETAQSDAIDADFSALRANALNLSLTQGDGLDVSGSNAVVHNSQFGPLKDKGISIGENSVVKVYNSKFRSNERGIAVKDSSILYIDKDSQFEDCKYEVDEYIKKPYFSTPTTVQM